jgi:uncharacterized protein (DUF433 family)
MCERSHYDRERRLLQLEDYFDFLGPDDSRIRGSRVGIETVLNEYLKHGRTAEQIQASFPTRALEEAYAAILYYRQNREALDQYMAEWYAFGRRMHEEQRRNPPPAVVRLRPLMDERGTGLRAS